MKVIRGCLGSNKVDGTIKWWKKFDDMCNCLDRIPVMYAPTDEQTDLS